MGAITRAVSWQQWLDMPEVPDGTEEPVHGETRVMPHAKLKHALIIEGPARQLRRQADERETPVPISQFGLAIRHQRLASRVLSLGMTVKNIVEQDGSIHPGPESVAEVLLPADKHADRNKELADCEALVAEVHSLRRGPLRFCGWRTIS